MVQVEAKPNPRSLCRNVAVEREAADVLIDVVCETLSCCRLTLENGVTDRLTTAARRVIAEAAYACNIGPHVLKDLLRDSVLDTIRVDRLGARGSMRRGDLVHNTESSYGDVVDTVIRVAGDRDVHWPPEQGAYHDLRWTCDAISKGMP